MMLEIIIMFGLGWFLGWRMNDALRTAAVKELLKELGIKDSDLRRLAAKNGIELPETAAAEPELKIIEVRLEQHQGQIFAYRKDDDTFLGQGHDAEAVVKRLTENLEQCRVTVAEEDGAALLQKRHT
jgi:hypothetical protein